MANVKCRIMSSDQKKDYVIEKPNHPPPHTTHHTPLHMSSVAQLKSVTAQVCNKCPLLNQKELWVDTCSLASGGAGKQCQDGIKSMIGDIPSKSQTGATYNNFPCCYVRDAMCKPTKEDTKGLFNPSIKAINAKYNVSLKYRSNLSICEQLKKY